MDNSTKCPKCGQTKLAHYDLCWRCFTARREAAEFAKGYAAGLAAGRAAGRAAGHAEGHAEGYAKGVDAGRASVAMDLTMWRRLQQLCHPDKHGNSPAAARVSAWLNSVRPN